MLSGMQYRQISTALLSAFDVDGLKQLARFELDIDLDTIATGDLESRVFTLIDHAERAGRVSELLRGAAKQNPGNEKLRAIIDEALVNVYGPGQKKTVAPVGYL